MIFLYFQLPCTNLTLPAFGDNGDMFDAGSFVIVDVGGLVTGFLLD